MDDQLKLTLIGYFLLILLDGLLLSDARRLLLDFLIGQRNRKNAMRIHAEQSLRDRILMGYIAPMLKKHQKAFRGFRILYLILLYSLVPQYAAVILIHIFAPDILWYAMGALLILRFLLTVYYRLELGPNRVSVYGQKSKN